MQEMIKEASWCMEGGRVTRLGSHNASVLSIFGATSVLGNPAGLVMGIGSGVADIFRKGAIRVKGPLLALPSSHLRLYVRDSHARCVFV